MLARLPPFLRFAFVGALGLVAVVSPALSVPLIAALMSSVLDRPACL